MFGDKDEQEPANPHHNIIFLPKYSQQKPHTTKLEIQSVFCKFQGRSMFVTVLLY